MIQKGICKVLIFDFDGVIVESNGIKDEAFRQLFSQFPAYAEEMMRYHAEHVSASRVMKFEYLLKISGRENDVLLKEQLMIDFSKLTQRLMQTVSFVPGAISFLKEEHPLSKYLASVTPIDDLKNILRHLNLTHYFKGVYGCPPWTKSNAVRDILLNEKINRDEAILIGDSAGDQRCASETGIHFIARNSGLRFDAPLPERIFTDLAELSAHFNEYIL